MTAPQKKKYAAFISYRHLSPDMEIARALAKMLEHNMIRPNRHVKRNIGPVFVDVNELPLTESLDASILHALDESEMLIVICSPNLPLSKYCMREISYFKEQHGGRMDRIYTLLVDGDPMTSFPEILRTEQITAKDEDGEETTVTVDVEPLFADVRAATIKESIKKLRKTEYLRLAAAYYHCSYDDLVKRRQRWLWQMGLSGAAIVGAAALGFNVYAYAKNWQYSSVKAATYASYAKESSEAGDELLAITLAQEAWEEAVFSDSVPYMTALRSAAVQYDYKLRAEPLSVVMSAEYIDGSHNDTVMYQSKNGTVSILMAENLAQITDAQTGALLLRTPSDLLKVDNDDLTWYITISAQADETGVLQDTLTFWSLEEQEVLSTYALRPSTQAHPNYHLYVKGQALQIRDGEETLIWLDRQGNRLTEDEAARLSQEKQPASDAPFAYYAGSNGLKKTLPTIKNAAGEVMLTLPAKQLPYSFSPDWAYFAYVYQNAVQVYDAATWEAIASLPLDAEAFSNLTGKPLTAERFSSLTLLGNSTYVMLTYYPLYTKVPFNLMFDWQTGECLGAYSGHVYAGAEETFYTLNTGMITRYQYANMDLAATARILAQQGDLFLTRNEDTITLVQGDGSIRFQVESVQPYIDVFNTDNGRVQFSEDLSRILIRQADGLTCYDQAGSILWQVEYSGKCFAMAKDGSLAAWLDGEGNAHVVSAADGKVQYTVPAASMTGVSHPDSLAVSSAGLCVCDNNHPLGDGAFEDRALWFPAGTTTAVDLGRFGSATLFADGVLILSGDSYVQDFAVWDVKAGRFLFQPGDNTGSWAYNPGSGYLVRHLETSGSHASLELEVLQLRKGQFASCGRIALPHVELTELQLDSTGEYLSLTAGSVTRIYRLADFSALLETTDLPMYYESGQFISPLMRGGQIYTAPLLEGDALRAFATEAITSGAGVRQLTLEERSRYSFD